MQAGKGKVDRCTADLDTHSGSGERNDDEALCTHGRQVGGGVARIAKMGNLAGCGVPGCVHEDDEIRVSFDNIGPGKVGPCGKGGVAKVAGNVGDASGLRQQQRVEG